MVDIAKIAVVRAFLAALASLLLIGPSVAQEARVFGDGPITVRLCPATCKAVNGHGYKPGAPAQVLETKDGWARVSSFLPRRQLISSFGWRAVPRKPALWVALSSLKAAPAPAAAAPTAAPRTKKVEKPKPRRVDVVTRLARLRNPSVPSFRPGTEVAVATTEPAVIPEAVVEETPAAEPEKPQEVAVVAPVEPTPPPAVVEPKPVVETAPEPPKVVEEPAIVEPVAPAAVSSSGDGKSETLTWEQLQARLAAQKEQAAKSSSEADAAAARQAAEAAKAEAARIAQQQEAQKAAEAARLARQAEADRLAREAEAREVAEAKARADELAAQQAREQAEADKLARQKAEADEAARQKAQADAAAKAEQQRLAEEKRREAEAEAARIAAKQAAPKTAGSVGYTPPQPDEAPAKAQVTVTEDPVVPTAEPKAEATQVAAVKLPPVAPTPAPTAAPEPSAEADKPQFTGPEPTYRTAAPNPMDFGSRPTKLTKKLLDKRLQKLPGRKSKMPKEVVIALRHYGLGLLDNGECTGVARGGVSASPGMIFIACTDDPTYLRQFPLQEQSW